VNEHRHRFVPINDPIDQVVAWLAVSIPSQVLRHLSIFAARFNISPRAAISEAKTEFIITLIATASKYVESHPDFVHEMSRIFRPVADITLTRDMFRAAE
jgi:hypothetical protein